MDDKYRGRKIFGEDIVDVDEEADVLILSSGFRIGREQAERIIAIKDKYKSIRNFPLDNLSLDGAKGRWGFASTGRNFGKSTAIQDEADDTGVWNSSIWNWDRKPEESAHPAVACDHVWIDVGFQFSKFVCSKCNTERKD